VVLLATATPSEPIVAIAIAAFLFAVTRPMILRLSRSVGGHWLVKVLTISLILHLLAAPLQIWVVDHLYGGIADWLRYDHAGAVLSTSFRHFDFSVVTTGGKQIVGDGSVSILVGIVFAIIGVNQLGAFVIFAWLAFLGLTFFFRAFVITFGGAGYRRYAMLLFFLPSLIFWTADVSKEAVMTLALGLIAFGAAKFMVRQRGGLTPIVIGTFIAAWVRPNELLLVIVGAVVAIMVLPSSPLLKHSGLKRLLAFLFLSGVLIMSIYLTIHFLHGKGGSLSLNQIAKNNSGHGSSVVGYSSSPASYPRDVYTVLFDPLPFNAHSKGELVAAAENMVVLGVIFASLRQLRILIRASFARPYILLCTIYSIGFIYTFAALGDLGLITRERTLLFPFMLVILSIPRSPRGDKKPRYEWELRRRDRLARRRRGISSKPEISQRPRRSGAQYPVRSRGGHRSTPSGRSARVGSTYRGGGW
jgi:hypothetical protein